MSQSSFYSLTYTDACSLYDYHDRTGLLPDDCTEAAFNYLIKKYNLKLN